MTLLTKLVLFHVIGFRLWRHREPHWQEWAGKTRPMPVNRMSHPWSGRRKHDHLSDVMETLGWMTVHQLVTYFDICLLHSIISNGKPEVLRSSLVYNHERVERGTRQSNHLSLPRVRNNHEKKRFIYRATQQYNDHVISRQLNNNVSKRVLKKNICIIYCISFLECYNVIKSLPQFQPPPEN